MYDSSDKFFDFRLFCGLNGIPIIFPNGKYHTIIPKNDVKLSVISFRMELPHIKNITK